MTCSLCPEKRVDSYLADAGNNAETEVVVDLCAAHMEEMETDSGAFDLKYADKIEALVGRQ